MAQEYAIKLHDVSLRFQGRRRLFHADDAGYLALSGVTLDLVRGEKLGVIGGNGAGKSTLLRVLAGVLTPDVGLIERAPGSCRLLALGSGFMPQLSGRENAVLSGLILGMRRRDIVARLEAVKQFSELDEFFDQPVRTYSSGMRARLAFSVAIQQEPDVLLIDETLAVGDAHFNKKSKAALRERIDANATVVLVSHAASMIKDICDRVVWLDNGRIRGVGEPLHVLTQYEQVSRLAS